MYYLEEGYLRHKEESTKKHKTVIISIYEAFLCLTIVSISIITL